MTYQEPPPGWFPFGHHAAHREVPSLVFSEETGEDGLPLWERPLSVTIGETWFWGRDGKPLTVAEADRLLGDWSYRLVAEDTIGPYLVATTWLGVDYGWGEAEAPIIFETRLFAGPVDLGIDNRRYSTEADAIAGHEEVCTLVRAVYQPINTHERNTPHES